MFNSIKNLFKKKPKYHKIPLVDAKGNDIGLFCEFYENDSIYNTVIKAYGEIPEKIEVTSLI